MMMMMMMMIKVMMMERKGEEGKQGPNINFWLQYSSNICGPLALGYCPYQGQGPRWR